MLKEPQMQHVTEDGHQIRKLVFIHKISIQLTIGCIKDTRRNNLSTAKVCGHVQTPNYCIINQCLPVTPLGLGTWSTPSSVVIVSWSSCMASPVPIA